MTATRGSSPTVTEVRHPPARAAAVSTTATSPPTFAELHAQGNTMKLIPHHPDDRHGRREYRSPDGAWRVVRTRRPGGNRNEQPRWEVHERPEDHAPWHCHAAFERRRDAVVFLDTTAVPPGGESTAAAAATPSNLRPPNARMSHTGPANAGRRGDRSRTTLTKPAPATASAGRCAACSCTTRSSSRRATRRRPAGSANDSRRRPATGNAGKR